MWFDGWTDIGRIALSSLVIYGALIAILRFAGKRSLAKLNIFDLVVTIALGSILSAIVLNKDISISEGVTAFVALAGLQWGVSWASVRANWFKQLLRSDARILLKDGVFLEANMRTERITRSEVKAAIRKKGHGKIEDIAAVVLETDGELSVIVDGPAASCSALAPLLEGRSDTEND